MMPNTYFYCLILALLLLPLQPLKAQEEQPTPNIEVIDAERLFKIVENPSDTIYVVNFWATWCRPCIEEIPDFERAREELKNQKVRFLLISLDFKSDLEKKVLPFVTRQKLQSDVLLLDDTDYNAWMNGIETDWQGNIPATIIFNNAHSQRIFIDRKISYEFLTEKINLFLKS
ncbi:MAG: TlpA family protein disulfide reductase [Bernardetiaceae bacterium]|nr:TlpA family protein disulfide reductase [Bernardetiaceae bacterium]